MSRVVTLCFILLFLLRSCTSASQSELSKALTSAVKEKKISPKKMESILREYDMLRDDDNKKAREYAVQVLNAIEMGGDSSHIDVVRRQVVGSKGMRI
ncbi:MAG: hypothetical protein WD824_10440 [Cyclobacteriaceae bacterium]